MAQEQIIWTALPSGIRPGGGSNMLKLSVYVSPRLDGPILDSSDFANWPDRLKANPLAFDVVVDDGSARDIFRVRAAIVTASAPDPKLWRALFAPTTPVDPGAGSKPLPRPVSSYSARKLLGNVAAGYTLSAAGIQTEHYKAWHRPAESSVVKGAFPDLVRGVLPQIENPPPAVLRQPEQLAAASDADLNHLRNYLAEDLLRTDGNLGRDDRVRAALRIAGMLARARPPGSLIDVVPRTQDATSLFCQFWAFHSRDSLADPCASQLGTRARRR